LFEKYPEVDTMFFTKPVGKIQYNPEKNDFDWDKQYTLEIQNRMEEIEKEIEEMREQKIVDEQKQEELAKQQEIEAEEAKKEAEKLAQIEKERLEKEAKEREKEEKRLADLEEQKQRQEEKTRKEAEEQAKIESKQIEKEELKQEKKPPSSQTDISQQEQSATNQESNTVEPDDLQSDNNKPKSIQIDEIIETKQTTSQSNNKVQARPIPKYNSNKTTYGSTIKNKVNKVDVAGRTITKTEITENNITLVYVKVEYTWGGRYFFVEDEPGVYRNISEQYYNIKLKGKK